MTASADPTFTSAIEDYAREVFLLEEAGQKATTTAVAAAMAVAPASASVMLKRLAALGLADHAPYRGVTLTSAGRRVALEVIRHHRLLEQFLAEALGVPLEDVHAEADRLEHVLSDDVERRIDAALGHPTHDPHGHPIPDAKLNLERTAGRTLVDLEPDERATVRSVPDRDPELLRYLGTLELLPGRRVALRSVGPFGGPVTLESDSGEHAISQDLAALIAVA